MQWAAHNAMQQLLQDHWSLSRTAQQQCYEVAVVKNALQTSLGRLPQKKEISEKFHRNIKLAAGRQDDYSENLVKDALIALREDFDCAIIGPDDCGTREAGRPEGSVEQHRQAGCVGIKDCRPRGKEVGHGLVGGLPD